jgi:hypothetical protein
MMRLIILALAAVFLLSACGPQTTLVSKVDVLAFLSEEDIKGDTFISSGLDYKIPEEGLDSSEFALPAEVLERLEHVDLAMTSSFTLTKSTEPITVRLGIYLSKNNSVFEATPIEKEVTLAPGETQEESFSLAINEAEHPDLFELIKSGDFVLGVAFSTEGAEGASGKLLSELKKLNISLIADVSNPLSF